MSANKACAVFSSLLLLWLAGSGGDIVATAMTVLGRCECVEKVDLVRVKRVTDITVQPKNALCNEIQVMNNRQMNLESHSPMTTSRLTLKQGQEVCLNPDSEQGRKLLDCWRSHEMNVAKAKMCSRKKTAAR